MDNQPVVIDACCKNCRGWIPVEEKGPRTIGGEQRGLCHGVPPVPFPKFDRFGNMQGQMDLRPCPVASNVCHLFAVRPDLLPQPPAP